MDLILDDSKIRKGKPVGLPYVGSKKKISKKIAQIIAQNFGTDKPVYDLFGGGGAVALELMLNGFEDVHYNELDKMTFEAFRTALYDDFDVRNLIATRDEFLEILDSERGGIDELKLLVNSFGNDRKSYLYSKSMSEIKTNLAKKIVWEENDWRHHQQTETYKLFKVKRVEQLERIKQIEQIQQIQQIERIKQVEQKDLKCTNFDYKHFGNLSGTILYLDPPYEQATDKYKLGKFNSAEFYDWAFNMSELNTVIISSYEVNDERFESVFEFKTARSTLSAKGFGNRNEKLFMVKAGL
jgi:site-specific DNA-adenine methylase